MGKLDSMQENAEKMDILRKNQKEMLETKTL